MPTHTLRAFRESWHRIRSAFRRNDLESRLSEEIRFHIDQQTEINVQSGMNPEKARQSALASFGAVERFRDDTRDQFRIAVVQDSLQDIRYGLRSLRRTPSFTLVALLTLGLSIGASTAVFTLVRGVLMKPLPFPDAGALVSIKHLSPDAKNGPPVGLSASLLLSYARENHVFRNVGAWARGTNYITGRDVSEEITSVYVTNGLLAALSTMPATGRVFSEAEYALGSEETVLLTHGYWQRRFGGDLGVVGQRVSIDAQSRTVIGIMPASFRFLNENPDVILPIHLDVAALTLGGFNYEGIARLAPGVTPERAAADIKRILPSWIEAWPSYPGVDRASFAGMTPIVLPLKDELVGGVSKTLWVLMGTVAIVLLIACANVASLVLVRAEARHHELLTRAALGASRMRLARGMLIECLILGISGGVIGLALASGALRILTAIGPVSIPRLGEASLDPIVVLFAMLLSVLAALIVGLTAVHRTTGRDIAHGLRSGGRGMSGGRERHRVRSALVVTQVALATVLLVGAGLMIRTFIALRDVPPGFTDPQHVQLVRVTVPEARVGDSAQVARMQRAMFDRIAQIPGVSDVSFTGNVPMAGERSRSSIFRQDGPADEVDKPSALRWFRFVAPGLVKTLGTRVVAGREFEWSDVDENRPVVVISKNLAREMWGNAERAIGKRIRDGNSSPWREVIGVVDDVYDDGVDRPAPAMVYWPWTMQSFNGKSVYIRRSITFAIRSDRAGSRALFTDVQNAVRAVDADVPLTRVRTLGDVYDRTLDVRSFAATMIAIAAGVALFLGVVGIYGVIAYTIAQRRREIGIRMALGAMHHEVQRRLVQQGITLGAIGVSIGMVGAAAIGRLLASLLFGTSAFDLFTFGVVSLGLVAIAGLASYIPARNATSIDPLIALRNE